MPPPIAPACFWSGCAETGRDERHAAGSAVDLSRRGGGIRRRARRRFGARVGGRHGQHRDARRCRRARHGRDRHLQSVSDRRPRDLRSHGHSAAGADHLAPHPRNRGLDRRNAPRRGRHHRQSGLHPSGGAPRAAARADDPHTRLCLAIGLGVAAGARACHARLRRLRACDPAVRTAGAPTARRSALRLCRPPDGGTPRRTAPQSGRSEAAPGRSAARARAAGEPVERDPPAVGHFRRCDRRPRPARRARRAGAADGAAPSGARARRRCRLAGEAAHRGRSGGKMDGLPLRARCARGVRHSHARARARRRAARRSLSPAIDRRDRRAPRRPAQALEQRHSRQSGHRRKRRAGIFATGLHAAKARRCIGIAPQRYAGAVAADAGLCTARRHHDAQRAAEHQGRRHRARVCPQRPRCREAGAISRPREEHGHA